MKLARTVASSVSGRFSHCQNATIAATSALKRMSPPTIRPTTRRHPPPGASSGSAIASATEHPYPEDQCDEQHEARVHERARPEIGVDADAREEFPEHDGADDADQERRHPGREVRPRQGDVGAWPASREHYSSD